MRLSDASPMEYKRLLVLANSFKKDGRCVAGREALRAAPLRAGNWVRPISDQPEGELLPSHMVIEHGKRVAPLDVVDVPISGYADDPAHPEDWFVSGDEWKLVETLTRRDLPPLVEHPSSLWLDDPGHSDRVSSAFLEKSSNHQSLYLVRPERLRLRLWREFNSYRGYTQKKTRALFNYGGASYSLSLTDPIATNLYCHDFPDENQAANEAALPFADNCVLCVSLTPPLNGVHYKVVATILELP